MLELRRGHGGFFYKLCSCGHNDFGRYAAGWRIDYGGS